MSSHLTKQEKILIRKILALLKRYPRVRMCFIEDEYYAPLRRRRILNRAGKCVVAYKGSSYKKFTGYSSSCFWERHYDAAKTLEQMFLHDGDCIRIIEVGYGKFFKKKLRLPKK